MKLQIMAKSLFCFSKQKPQQLQKFFFTQLLHHRDVEATKQLESKRVNQASRKISRLLGNSVF